jgi:hypothetical protein
MNWSVGSVTSGNWQRTVTYNVTIPYAEHQLLIFMGGSSDFRDAFPSTITFDGDNMATGSAVRTNPASASAVIYYIDISGKSAGTYDLYHNFAEGTPDEGGYAYFLVTGGDGTKNTSSSATGTTDPSTSITTNINNCLIVDCFFHQANSNRTAGSGQTSLFQFNPFSAGNRFGGSYEVKVAKGSETMSWSGSNDTYAHAVSAFNIARNKGGAFILNSI